MSATWERAETLEERVARRELVTAGRPTIDRGWKTRQVTGAMVSAVSAPNRAGREKGRQQDV